MTPTAHTCNKPCTNFTLDKAEKYPGKDPLQSIGENNYSIAENIERIARLITPVGACLDK